MVELLTDQGVITLLGAVLAIVGGSLEFNRRFVKNTVKLLRGELVAADTDRGVLRSELEQERLTRQRLEDKVVTLEKNVARIEGQSEERELAVLRMGAELREAHENNGKLKHANDTTVKESKKLAESKDKLITKITAERNKLADELETTKKDLQQALADQAKLEVENKRLKAEVAAKKKTDEQKPIHGEDA